MNRAFDHSRKILLAVEFGTAPRTLPCTLPGYAIFRRLSMPEVVWAFDEQENLPGYFNSAHEAGRHTFTVDSEYLWYGMLLRKLP